MAVCWSSRSLAEIVSCNKFDFFIWEFVEHCIVKKFVLVNDGAWGSRKKDE